MAKVIGKVTHYYDKAGVAVVDLSAPLASGETVTLKRGDNQFTQQVTSMQIDNENIDKAKAKTSIGLKVDEPTKPGTIVFRGELPAE